MRKQLVALTLSAAMAAGMLSGCGGYGSGSGGQKDAAEAAAAADGSFNRGCRQRRGGGAGKGVHGRWGAHTDWRALSHDGSAG
ncbi:MAG: hypothetical protein ACLTBV_28440 [Enterocloster bolteae]